MSIINTRRFIILLTLNDDLILQYDLAEDNWCLCYQDNPDLGETDQAGPSTAASKEQSSSSQKYSSPNHPDTSVISKQTIKTTIGTKVLSFQGHWYKRFKWLQMYTGKKTMLCFYCSTEIPARPLTAKKYENTFVSTGFSNWRKFIEKCERHEKSQQHI